MPRNNDIQLRRGTSTEWNNTNPVLNSGEPGFDISKDVLKIGDGSTPWSGLAEFAPFNTSLIAGSGISLIYDSGNSTLTINSSGSGGGGGGLDNVVEDLTPQLGGNLDLNLNDIVGTGNISISGNIIANSGAYNALTVSGVSVSVSGHVHTTGDIIDFASGVADIVDTTLSAGTGIALNYDNITNDLTINVIDSPRIVTTVFNKTGFSIPKFRAVYINGGQGDQATITLASNTGDATSANTYGVTSEAIDNMSTGEVVVFGALTGINTDQFNPSAPVGDVNGTVLYLDNASGLITSTKPYAPNHIVAIGTIVRTHQNEGVVEVRIQNGFELEELHDVSVTGATSGQFLQYNSASDLWIPSSSGNFSTLQVNGTAVPTGVGASNYTTKWTGTNSLGTGIIYDDGTNVGIGTTTPTKKLDVRYPASGGVAIIKSTDSTDGVLLGDIWGANTAYQGLSHIDFSSTSSYMIMSEGTNTLISADTGGSVYLRGGPNNGSNEIRIYPANSDGIVINEQGADSNFRIEGDTDPLTFFVDAGANSIGIGTSTPSAKLNVENGNVIFNDLGGNYDFRVGGDTDANLLFVDASLDYIGIGTPYPLAKLNVLGTKDVNYGTVNIQDSTSMAANVGGDIIFGGKYTTAGAYARYGRIGGIKENSTDGNSQSAMIFHTNAGNSLAERVRINSSGNVGIGTSSPTEKLDVNGSIKTRTGGVGHEDNGCYIAYPGGGTLRNGGNPQSGYLKITLPVSWTSTMLQFEFDLYEYSTGLLKKFRIAGYNFLAGSYWANVSAMVDSDNDFTQYRVHFGHDGTYCAIYISKISSSNVDLGASSTWLYPHGSISNFFGGWSNFTMENWADGWSIGFTTTLGTITNTRDASRPYRQHDTSYVFNEYGGNVDFRVEGDTDANLFFTDASTDRIGIGTNNPQVRLHVQGGSSPYIRQTFTNSESAAALYHFDNSLNLGGILSYGSGVTTGTIFNLGAGSIGLYSFYDDLGLGTFGVAKDVVLGTNSIERVRINASGNFIFNEAGNDCDFRIEGDTNANLLFTDASVDRVGIGTSAPLDIFSVEPTNATTDLNGMSIRRNSSWGGSYANKYLNYAWRDLGSVVAAMGAYYDGNSVNIDFHSMYNATYKTSADVVMSIHGDGNIGIGTKTPSARLNVESGNIIFNDLGGNYDFRVEGDTDTNLLFTDANTDRVGVGTNSPLAKLHVSATGVSSFRVESTQSYAYATLKHNSPNQWAYLEFNNDGVNRAFLQQNGTTTTSWGGPNALSMYNYAGPLSFGTNTTSSFIERMAIDVSGNVTINDGGLNADFRVEGDNDANLLFTDASVDRVGIGTNAPAYKLDVVGTGHFDALNINGAYTFPTIVGTSGTTLIGDGAGGVSWTTVGTSGVANNAITYDKLSNSATEGDNVQKRVAKAWVNFNGTGTVAIRDDFNVSSITDGGVGIYTINFESPMTDTDYSSVGICSSTAQMGIIWDGGASYTRTSSAYQFATLYVSSLGGAGAAFDTSIVQLIIFR